FAGAGRRDLGAGGAARRTGVAADWAASNVPGNSGFAARYGAAGVRDLADAESAALDAGLHRFVAGCRILGHSAVQFGWIRAGCEWFFAAAVRIVAAAGGRVFGAGVRSAAIG